MSEARDNPLEDLGIIGDAVMKIRSRLRPGGPEVDYPVLHAYVAGALAEEDKRVVAQRIVTWQPWFHAYWEVRAEVDNDEAAKQLRQENVVPWLSLALNWQQLSASTLTAWAALLTLIISRHLHVRLSLGKTRAGSSEADKQKEPSVEEVTAHLSSGLPITLSGEDRWVVCSVQADSVTLRLASDPTEPLPWFRLEFLHDDNVVVSVSGRDGSVTLTQQHMQKVTQALANRMRIVPLDNGSAD